MSGKVDDFLNASKEEITDMALDSGIVQPVVTNLASLAL